MEKIVKKTILKPLDIVIMCIALIFIAYSLFLTLSNQQTGATLVLTDSEGEWVYDLKSDRTIGGSGPLGVSIISIENESAFFLSSPCANQICVHSNPINTNANFIACLPNQIFIRIEAETEKATTEELDIVGY